MNSPIPPRPLYRFGVFQLDPAAQELYKHGIRVKLQEQPFRVLLLLIESPGAVVSREELRKKLWEQDTYVDFDHSLNITLNKLRAALGDSASQPRFIETVPRLGYRFLAPVQLQSRLPEATSTPASLPSPEPAVASALKNTGSKSRLPGLAALAAVLLIAAGLSFWFARGSKPARPERALLAVMPFDNQTSQLGDEYFVAGLQDEMIGQLGRLNPAHLGVIARTSVSRYAGTRMPVRQIAQELHVNFVLTGNVFKAGDHFRIAAELIDAQDETRLWGQTYEPGMGSMATLQEDVARQVSRALAIELLPEAMQQLHQSSTTSGDAYRAYLQGRFLWYQETRSSLQQALGSFQHAVDMDPNYAPAYVGMADAYNVLGGYGFVPPADAFPRGKAAAQKALQLAPELSDAYASLAFSAFYYDWDWKNADALFRKAIELNANNQVAHTFYTAFLHATGRLDEAEAQNRIANELDPMSAWVYDDKGWLMLSRRRPQDAIVAFRKGVSMDRSYPAAHLSLAVALSRVGKFQEALDEVRQAEALHGDPTRVLEVLGSVQALSGDRAGAQATLEKLKSGNIAGRVSPYSVALIYNALGRTRDSLDWLEKGVRERDTWCLWIKVLVEWQNLRNEPRFQKLLSDLQL